MLHAQLHINTTLFAHEDIKVNTFGVGEEEGSELGEIINF